MVGSLITYTKCPFCPPRRGVLAVDVDALRAVVGIFDVDLNTGPVPPALVFDPDRGTGGPCEHVMDLVGLAGWEWRDERDREQPGGCLELIWTHPLRPSARMAEWDRWNDFSADVLRPGSDHPLRPRTPRVDVRADLERCIPEVSKGRSWRLWLWGMLDAQFARDPEDYYRQVGDAFRRYPGRRGPAGP